MEGASAGVGTGSAVGVLAAVAVLFVSFRRFRIVRRSIESDTGKKHDNGVSEPHELGLTLMVYETIARSVVHEAGVGMPHKIHETPFMRLVRPGRFTSWFAEGKRRVHGDRNIRALLWHHRTYSVIIQVFPPAWHPRLLVP